MVHNTTQLVQVVNGGEDVLQVHLQGSSPLGVSWRFQMRCARKLMVGMRYCG
jgi:hypothetical protein